MDRVPKVRQSVGPKAIFNPTFIDRERDAQSLAPKRTSRRSLNPGTTIDVSDNSFSEEEEASDADSEDQEFIGYQSFLKDNRMNPKTAPTSRTIRVQGGRAAVTKRVTVQLDSDDEIIKDMKDQGYRDVDVQRRLVAEGRTKYAEKSITTRYNRISRALNEDETKTLDDELTDWHDGDDEMLDASREKYQQMYENAMDRASNSYWLNVAKDVHLRQAAKGEKKKRFSRNACRERWLAREAGTALPPLESDPDQTGRQAAHAKRKAEIAANRAATEEQKIAKDAEALRKYQEEMDVEKGKRHKHLTRKEHKEIADAIRNKKDAERSERARAKAQAAEERNALKASRAEENKRKQAEKVDNRRARAQAVEDKREDAKQARARNKKDLELKQLERLMEEVKGKFNKQQDKRDVTATIRRVMHARLDEQDKASGLTGVKRARLGANVVKEDSAVIIAHLRKTHAPSNVIRIKSEDGEGGDAVAPSALANTGNIQDKSFLSDPRANPRGFMAESELIAICISRNVAYTSVQKRNLVQTLMTADNARKSHELRNMLRDRGLPVYGDKSTLIWRISNDDAGKLAKGSDMYQQIKQQAKAYASLPRSGSVASASLEQTPAPVEKTTASGGATKDLVDASTGSEEDENEGESDSSYNDQPATKKAKLSSK